MSEKSTISTGPDRDDPPRFTREMADRGRHVVGGTVIREAKPRGRPKKAEGEKKEAVSLRLSPEVLAHFRSSGDGWQTRIDEALLSHVQRATLPAPLAGASSTILEGEAVSFFGPALCTKPPTEFERGSDFHFVSMKMEDVEVAPAAARHGKGRRILHLDPATGRFVGRSRSGKNKENSAK